MSKIIGVRLKDFGKPYFFSTKETDLSAGDKVIVKTSRGMALGTVALLDVDLDKTDFKYKDGDIKKIIRKATKNDIKRQEENKSIEKRAFDVCNKNIMRLNIPMRLINVDCMFDASKILFYFTADGRVDFRQLVKSLALIFKTRIELRQIGVRDKAKLVGGLGACGREFCCKKFLSDFQPVSIKMAKEQGMSLNPVKISGICGRLMCCLKYEQESYEYMLKKSPKVGAVVDTEDGKGIVTEVNLLMKDVKVSLSSGENLRPKTYKVRDVKIIKDKKIVLEKGEFYKLKSLEGK